MKIDINGKEATITDVIEGMRARNCQISPNFVQININNETAIQMSESAWNYLKAGNGIQMSGRNENEEYGMVLYNNLREV